MTASTALAAMTRVLGLVGGLACGVVGCEASQQAGQECLKDDDCESKRCVAHACMEPGTGQPPFDAQPLADSGAEVPADGAPDGKPDGSDALPDGGADAKADSTDAASDATAPTDTAADVVDAEDGAPG